MHTANLLPKFAPMTRPLPGRIARPSKSFVTVPTPIALPGKPRMALAIRCRWAPEKRADPQQLTKI
jgi:hypothetical protein